MHQHRPTSQNPNLNRLGYFVGALLLHLVVFLMVATMVIWNAPKPPLEATFQKVSTSIPPPPPPPQPPSSGDAAQNPQLEPQPVAVPVVTPPQILTSVASTSFTVDTSKVMQEAASHLPALAPQGSGLTQGTGNTGGAGSGSVFGSTSGSSNQLVGYLYDLKQTPDHKPTGMTPGAYHQILQKFVASHWDESILAPYYKSPKPLYTSAVYIPVMNAQLGPTAFGLQDEVKPSQWIVWYKGKVSPATPGGYRFAGVCDDILLVRVGGETVLDGSLHPVDTKKFDLPWPPLPGKHPLRRGQVFNFSSFETEDIDIIIGEQPGGVFYASLYALKAGDTFVPAPSGETKLPLFRVDARFKLPAGNFPEVSLDSEPWKCTGR